MGHELKFGNQKLLGNYLRMGYDPDGSWRIFKLRPDFNPADKVQFEDDITASVVLPRESLNHLDPEYRNESVKLVAELRNAAFPAARTMPFIADSIRMPKRTSRHRIFLFRISSRSQFRMFRRSPMKWWNSTSTPAPMKQLLRDFLQNPETDFVVSSAHPRIVDGGPSKNPRYLQKRPDLTNPRNTYLAEIGTRLAREIPADSPLQFPVNAVLSGRRNNPADQQGGHSSAGCLQSRFTIRNCPSYSWT